MRLLVLTAAALLFAGMGAVASPADKTQRVGIAWNATLSCPVTPDASAAFATAYSSGDDASALIAGKRMTGELFPCLSIEIKRLAQQTGNAYSGPEDTLKTAANDDLYASMQLALVMLNIAVRVKDYDAAKSAWKILDASYQVSTSGDFHRYSHEMSLVHTYGEIAARRVPGFSP